MGAINKEWHLAHRMPTKPTSLERGQWHAEHQQECACRTPSLKELELIESYKAQANKD